MELTSVPDLRPRPPSLRLSADEVMIVTITYDHAARRRSYELIAGP